MKMEIELQPLSTPNFVLQKEFSGSYQPGHAQIVPLRNVPIAILEAMCDEFKAEVIRKAKAKASWE